MSGIITDVLGKKKNSTEYMEKERKSPQKVSQEDMGMKNNKEQQYKAVSKNGDTLELSDVGRIIEKNGSNINRSKKIISDSGIKISDGTLAVYSEAKLRQLYAKKTITKQQYDKAMEKKSVN